MKLSCVSCERKDIERKIDFEMKYKCGREDIDLKDICRLFI